ncbi:MAG TPA: response regulator [Bryobacteraceae bacterium]|nr:response regulator [Bryobacteraceae bacterium]
MTQNTGLAVLSIGPADQHQAAFSKILQQSGFPAGGGTIEYCGTVERALAVLRNTRIPIVVCDADFGWRQVLDKFPSLPDPPFLIVTSRLADDRLWSEALNLGAYDVLAKPYDSSEVARVLNMAWVRWVERSATPAWKRRPVATMPMYA